MKSSRFLATAIFICMAVLAPGGAARAQGHGGGPPPGFGRPEGMERRMATRHHRMEMLEGLDLPKEQREKIADLREKQERAAIRVRADLQTARLDLRRLTRAEKADRMAINRQIDRIAQLRADMKKARIGMMLDIRALLTPEQQERMRELRGPLGPGYGRK
jgi:Spy/CpxP family protein refolding chaperone